MKLSSCVLDGGNLVRDGDFQSLGSVFSHNDRQLVYATRKDEMQKIASNSSVSCVITLENLVAISPDHVGVIIAEAPRKYFFRCASEFYTNTDTVRESFRNQIDPSADIHSSAVIASDSVVIGKNVVIGKHVVIHEQTRIDDGVIIGPNTIVGSTGNPLLSFEGCVTIQPQGGVHICCEAEIHANSQIDRPVFCGDTEIGLQSKIDNLVHIGGGTVIGNHCLVVACAEIGEAVCIGHDSWIGPNARIVDQICIGSNVFVTLGSYVSHDIADNKVVKDNFAIDRRRFSKVIRGM